MSRWETQSHLDADLDPDRVWNASARIVFRTGLRLRFEVIEHEHGRLFTDEARLPGARMGHRHLIERADGGGCRLANTIYVDGPLAPLWRRILGPAAARSLPDAQRAIVTVALAADS